MYAYTVIATRQFVPVEDNNGKTKKIPVVHRKLYITGDFVAPAATQYRVCQMRRNGRTVFTVAYLPAPAPWNGRGAPPIATTDAKWIPLPCQLGTTVERHYTAPALVRWLQGHFGEDATITLMLALGNAEPGGDANQVWWPVPVVHAVPTADSRAGAA